MSARGRAGWVLLFLAACGHEPTMPDPPGRVTLTGVTVVDGNGTPPVTGRTVVIDAGRIVSIGPDGAVPLDPDGEVLDLAGHWLMPGLIDTHVHMPEVASQPRFLDNLLSFGVTTARSTAAAPSGGTELRARLDAGQVRGPRFLTAGRLIDGPGSYWGGFGSVVSTEAELRAEVRAQAAQGVDFVKLYAGLGPELVAAGIQEAHARGLPVVGHLGRTSWGSAVAAGIDQLTHGCYWGMASSVVPRPDSARFAEEYLPNTDGGFDPALLEDWADAVDLDAPRFVELADAMRAGDVRWDPNLVLCEAVSFGDERAVLDRLQPEYDVQTASFPHPYSSGWTPEERAAAKGAFPAMLSVVGRLHREGVRLTLGTDTMNPWMTPGSAAHRELELLVEAGLTPSEALVVGTRNGAEALGILGDVGTVEVGKAADLLVLGGDPTEDISNVRDLRYVVAGGRPYEPGALRRRR